MARRVAFILAFTIVHVACTLVVGWTTYALGMERWDSGPSFPVGKELVYHNIGSVLQFPMLNIFPRPVHFGFPLIVLNGMIWATAAFAVWAAASRWHRRRRILARGA